MFQDISYHSDSVPIPARSSFSFDINSTLLPSAYKSVHIFHVRNELIGMVRIFSIGVGYNKSSFEDVVEFRFT
jgi:hypothetical protein